MKKVSQLSVVLHFSNLNRLLHDDFENYYFAEHSLYLLKEHFKMVIEFTKDEEMQKHASIILNKLNQINE